MSSLDEGRLNEALSLIRKEVREEVPYDVRKRLWELSNVRRGKIPKCEVGDIEIVEQFINDRSPLFRNLYPEFRMRIKGLICYYACIP